MDTLENNYTGVLLNPDNIKLHRFYFKEMCRLIGIKCLYRAPRDDKHYDGYGELDSFFYEPQVIECIYEQNIPQKTMRKLGWNSELTEGELVLSVAYDTFKIQKGALFIIPSAIDGAKGRVFQVQEISAISIYPASLTCKVCPLFVSTFEKSQLDHKNNNFSLLSEEE